MKTYEISWSYPSSPNAIKFGFPLSGCWTVSSLMRPWDCPEPIQGFRTREEAELYKVGMQAQTVQQSTAATMRNPEFL